MYCRAYCRCGLICNIDFGKSVYLNNIKLTKLGSHIGNNQFYMTKIPTILC